MPSYLIPFQPRDPDERVAAALGLVGLSAGLHAEPALRMGGRKGQGGRNLLRQVSLSYNNTSLLMT